MTLVLAEEKTTEFLCCSVPWACAVTAALAAVQQQTYTIILSGDADEGWQH